MNLKSLNPQRVTKHRKVFDLNPQRLPELKLIIVSCGGLPRRNASAVPNKLNLQMTVFNSFPGLEAADVKFCHRRSSRKDPGTFCDSQGEKRPSIHSSAEPVVHYGGWGRGEMVWKFTVGDKEHRSPAYSVKTCSHTSASRLLRSAPAHWWGFFFYTEG